MNALSELHVQLLKDYGRQNYDEFGFDAAYFETLANLMGVTADVSLENLEVDHFELVSVYFQSKRFEETAVSIEDENKALQKTQDHITALMIALNDLGFKGEIEGRIFKELISGHGSSFEHNGLRLSDLAGPQGPFLFENVVGLLFDLQLALEHSKIRRFKEDPVVESTLLTNIKAKTRAENLKRNVAAAALASQDEDPKERYQRLSKEYGKPRELPLLRFLEEFSVFWLKYSPLPFSEGRYEPDARQYISRTVDTAQFCLKQMNADYPFNTVAKQLRAVRESL